VVELVAGYRGGASMNELAQRHGVHRHTVAHGLTLDHCQLRRQGISQEQVPEIMRLYAEDWTLARLGEKYECDPETVRSALRSAGVVLRRPSELA
jgi:transposase